MLFSNFRLMATAQTLSIKNVCRAWRVTKSVLFFRSVNTNVYCIVSTRQQNNYFWRSMFVLCMTGFEIIRSVSNRTLWNVLPPWTFNFLKQLGTVVLRKWCSILPFSGQCLEWLEMILVLCWASCSESFYIFENDQCCHRCAGKCPNRPGGGTRWEDTGPGKLSGASPGETEHYRTAAAAGSVFLLFIWWCSVFLLTPRVLSATWWRM